MHCRAEISKLNAKLKQGRAPGLDEEVAVMDPEERFGQLLSRLKSDEPVYTSEPEHLSALRRPEPTPQLRSWAIRIMESPMFYKGGLRARSCQLPERQSTYPFPFLTWKAS